MLRRVPLSLRRALLSSASTHHGRAQIPNPSHSHPQVLLPQWRHHASDASSTAPPHPPPPPPPSPPGAPSRSGGGGPTVSSLNPAEVAKFAAIAETWWDSSGPFKPLHLMNPTRLSFIRSTLCRHFRRDPYSSKPLQGLKVIDVGCGGGILSEVIEHVANPLEFCKSLSALTVPNGATLVSTISPSMREYATAIVGAEYILRWLPKGTHEWSKLVTPEELALNLQKASVSVEEMTGFVYNPLSGEWSLSDYISVNYIAFGVKKRETLSTDGTKARLS